VKLIVVVAGLIEPCRRMWNFRRVTLPANGRALIFENSAHKEPLRINLFHAGVWGFTLDDAQHRLFDRSECCPTPFFAWVGLVNQEIRMRRRIPRTCFGVRRRSLRYVFVFLSFYFSFYFFFSLC